MTTISNTVAQYRCQRTGTVYSQITSSLLYISQLYSVLQYSEYKYCGIGPHMCHVGTGTARTCTYW